MIVFGLVLLCVITYYVDGQVTTPGRCPKLSPMPDFDFYRYEGVWFELEKYFFIPEITGKCVYVKYKNFHHHNNTFDADIAQVEKDTGKVIVAPSRGKLFPGHDRSARIELDVTVPIPLSLVGVRINYPYIVLATDYNTFSIKYACKDHILPIGKTETIWILARGRHYYSEETKEFVHQKLRDFGINPDHLIPSDQTNCPPPL